MAVKPKSKLPWARIEQYVKKEQKKFEKSCAKKIAKQYGISLSQAREIVFSAI